VESRNSAIKETTKSIHAQTIKLVAEQTEDVGVQLQDLDQAVANARSMNDKYHNISMESINKIVDGGRQFVQKFSSLIDTLRNEMGSFEEASDLAAQSIDAVESFSSNTRERLSQLRTGIESAPLKECLPTGQTPRKRKYTFPTILPSTGSAEDVLARARGGVIRTVLEEKEVNSPQKLTPGVSSILTDPKSGGAGIGAAFYPTVTNNKKKVFRDQPSAQGEPGGGVAESHMPSGYKENGFSSATNGGDPKKGLLKKRKAGETGAEEGMAGIAAITTRRRMR